MANTSNSNTDWTKSAGYSDQSHLVGDTGNALIGGESSSAGNTINTPATSVGAAPGSQPVNLPHNGPSDSQDSPALEVGSPVDHTQRERG